MKSRYCFFLILFWATGNGFAESNLESIVQKGNDLFLQMDYQNAITLYSDGIDTFPDEPVLFYNRANAFLKTGAYDDAISDYQAAEKFNPKKILLKNIYFNTGNAYYLLAEQAKKDTPDTLETLKKMLADYELAGDYYRKSLDIERELVVAHNVDLKKAGLYARKNRAIAREAWTLTWERIKALERENMKLEDGIFNLLKSQEDLLPPLENYYLISPDKTILDFNLKTLAQFHMDHKEDIAQLRELAEKEIERTHAELENYTASMQTPPAAPPATPPGSGTVPAEGPDKEREKLETALKNATEIKNAVDQAIGLSEWILDSLNTGKALDAWKYTSNMITLLSNLNDYLKKQDAIPTHYQAVQLQLKSVQALLFHLNALNESSEAETTFDTKEMRVRKLCTEKLDAAVRHVLFVNTQLERMITHLSETDDTSEKQGLTDSDEKDASDPLVQFRSFMKKMEKQSAIYVLTHIKDTQVSVQDTLKNAAARLLKNDTPPLKGIEKAAEYTEEMVNFYQHADKSMLELLVSLHSKAEKMEDDLSRKDTGDRSKDTALSLGHGFDPMNVLIFKYTHFVNETDKKDFIRFNMDVDRLTDNLASLKADYSDFISVDENDSQSRADVNDRLIQIRKIKTDLMQAIRYMAPDAAVMVFLDKLKNGIASSKELLPATSSNVEDILKKTHPLSGDLSLVSTILDEYFNWLTPLFKQVKDESLKDQLVKSLEFQKMTRTYIDKGRKEYDHFQKRYAGGKYMTGDLLLKDLADTIDKAYMIFSGQPDDAKKALQAAIQYQKTLKEHARSAIDIETEEGDSDQLAGFLAANQKDIQMFSGVAAMKIRQMLEAADTSQGADSQQLLPGQAGPQCGQVDPADLESAVTHVQDAMIEEEKIRSFLEAVEYHNTTQKHDNVIDLLQKALDLLQNKDGKNSDQQNGDNQNDPSENQRKNGEDRQNQDQGQGQQTAPSKPLELTSEQARELLNQLNKEDQERNEGEVKAGKPINVPRPW